MGKRRSRLFRWLAVIGWAAVIFAFSATPGSNLPGGYSVQAHFTEYAVLAALLFFALRVDRSTVVALALAIVIASAYGITDEFHQSFVPLRTPDPIDWLTDTAGAIAGASLAAGAYTLIARRRKGL